VIRLVLAALRARRAQAVALFALTVLAALGASAAPWYLSWARTAVAEADVAGAPSSQRVVVVNGSAQQSDTSPFPQLRERVASYLDVPDSVTTVGARMFVSARNADPAADVPATGLDVSSRDELCQHVRIEGACPTNPGDVILARDTAERLGVRAGDGVILEGFRLEKAVSLRVSGVYDVIDPLEVYWAGTNLLNPTSSSAVVSDPAFVSEPTLLSMQAEWLDMYLHLVLPDTVFSDPVRAGDLLTALTRAGTALREGGLTLSTSARDLADQIARDQALVTRSVVVAAVQLVLLCWVGLFLAVRHTADERRGDIGLMKLRGSARWRLWTLAAQPSALPMLAGAVLGWGLGYLVATGLAGESPGGPVATTTGLSAAAAGVAAVGALIAAVVAERRMLLAPVLDLLRRVPDRGRGWRAGVADLVIVAVAGVGVYQGYADARSGTGASVLALLAPGLVALAVALLSARALPWLAARVGTWTLRSGRPGAALTALHLGRRPGTHRVFAVLTVAVAILAIDAVYWRTATEAWDRRAGTELGAPRVLTVRAANSTALLGAVRAADPTGGYAMAVARAGTVGANDAFVAVDTPRLAAVAVFPPEYGGGDADRLAELLRPPVGEPVRVDPGPLSLEARDVDPVPDEPASIRVHLVGVDGSAREVEFGPLGPDRRAYEGVVTGCDGGCRLQALELTAPRDTATVELFRLSQAGRDVVSAAAFGDVRRWRGPVGATGVGNLLQASPGRMALSLYNGQLPPDEALDTRVFVADSPVPLPVVLAGDRPKPRRPGEERLTVMGTEPVPYTVVATASVLPRLGARGALVDLEYAQHSIGGAAEVVTLEVWLAADAPADVVTRLRERGVEVMTDVTDDRLAGRLSDQGPGIALRFHLLSAAVLLLLAVGMVMIMGAVERRARSGELAALRAQGLARASVRRSGYGGAAVMVAGAVLAGLVAAFLADVIVTAALPVFADDWALLPSRGRGEWLASVVAAAGAAVLLAAAAAVGSASLVRATASERGGRPE
jgi:putative ABC transport system permease protein